MSEETRKHGVSVLSHYTFCPHCKGYNERASLSHVSTKKKLTEYFAQRTIEIVQQIGRNTVVSWACECEETMKNMTYLKSNQEEADTKIILHALDATTNKVTDIKIHSPDTDVLILALRQFPRI